MLDTAFGDGHHFLQLWQRWREHAQRPALLHYVGVLSASQAAVLPAATAAAIAQPGLALDPGFHRILLEDGQLSLTLCVGETLDVLPRQDMQADSVLAAAHDWDKWQLKALARCCRLGTELLFHGPELPAAARLAETGFKQLPHEPQANGLRAVYQPDWTPRRRSAVAGGLPSTSSTGSTAASGRCAVIGSGLAGAAVAQALARRGWQVDVYEAGAHCAAGASGLPVGLVVPHHSLDDAPRSRLSRSGTRLMLAHAQRLLQDGQDWHLSGVLERHIAPDGLLSEEVLSEKTADGADLWHPHAAWIKPALLITRWLQHPCIRLLTHSAIHGLEPVSTTTGTQWRLSDAHGRELGVADQVVFANAHACVELLQRLAGTLPPDFPWVSDVLGKLSAMQVLHGTLSTGAMPAGLPGNAFPAHPVNGHGSFISGIPGEQGPRWYAGSTFQTDPSLHADLAGEQAINQAKLKALLPDVAAALEAQFAQGQVQAWQSSRCVSHDRLPLVGPLTHASGTEVNPTLWLCAGMGARGLSFSALCAELLVAWMGHEPLPVENTLARSLSSARMRRKRARATD